MNNSIDLIDELNMDMSVIMIDDSMYLVDEPDDRSTSVPEETSSLNTKVFGR